MNGEEQTLHIDMYIRAAATGKEMYKYHDMCTTHEWMINVEGIFALAREMRH